MSNVNEELTAKMDFLTLVNGTLEFLLDGDKTLKEMADLLPKQHPSIDYTKALVNHYKGTIIPDRLQVACDNLRASFTRDSHSVGIRIRELAIKQDTQIKLSDFSVQSSLHSDSAVDVMNETLTYLVKLSSRCVGNVFVRKIDPLSNGTEVTVLDAIYFEDTSCVTISLMVPEGIRLVHVNDVAKEEENKRVEDTDKLDFLNAVKVVLNHIKDKRVDIAN